MKSNSNLPEASNDHDDAWTFTDRSSRNIRLEDEGLKICAYHNERRIGWIEFDESDHAGTYLWGMEVEPAYRRAGIASAMMKIAAQTYGRDFGRPSFSAQGGSSASCSSEYFTQEGALFFRYCIENDIVDDRPDVEVLNEPAEHD